MGSYAEIWGMWWGMKPKEQRENELFFGHWNFYFPSVFWAVTAATNVWAVYWEGVLQRLLMTVQNRSALPMGQGGTDIVRELWHVHGGSQTSGFHFPPLARQWALAAGLFNEIVYSTSCAISLAYRVTPKKGVMKDMFGTLKWNGLLLVNALNDDCCAFLPKSQPQS